MLGRGLELLTGRVTDTRGLLASRRRAASGRANGGSPGQLWPEHSFQGPHVRPPLSSPLRPARAPTSSARSLAVASFPSAPPRTNTKPALKSDFPVLIHTPTHTITPLLDPQEIKAHPVLASPFAAHLTSALAKGWGGSGPGLGRGTSELGSRKGFTP